MAQIVDEQDINKMNKQYMSDRTSYMKWSTELEPKSDVTDSTFMRKHRNKIRLFDKFAPLGYFKYDKDRILQNLYMQDTILAENLGLNDTAEETGLSAINNINTGRGKDGFYQNALITERHEIKEENTDMQKKVGFFNKLFGGKKEEQQGEQQR